MAANRKIRLSGDPYRRVGEAECSAAVKPGMLIQMGSDGRVAPNGTQGALVPQRIATETMKVFQGETVDDEYAIGDMLSFDMPMPGDHFNLLLAAGANVSVGTKLISKNDGTFIATTGTPAQTAWESAEALDLSASGVAQLVRAVFIGG